jgi:uncharacterized membrane protein YdbT with pleckstrin-like domain
VLIKFGTLRRRTVDLLLPKVEGVVVEQGLMGQLLGFGTIVVTGTGGMRERFEQISAPLEFRRQVQTHASSAHPMATSHPVHLTGGEVVRHAHQSWSMLWASRSFQ